MTVVFRQGPLYCTLWARPPWLWCSGRGHSTVLYGLDHHDCGVFHRFRLITSLLYIILATETQLSLCGRMFFNNIFTFCPVQPPHEMDKHRKILEDDNIRSSLKKVKIPVSCYLLIVLLMCASTNQCCRSNQNNLLQKFMKSIKHRCGGLVASDPASWSHIPGSISGQGGLRGGKSRCVYCTNKVMWWAVSKKST